MAKEDDVVAAAMAKPIRDGYPKLTEDHPFFGKLRAFTNKKLIGLNGYRPTYRNERYHNAAEYGYQTAEQILVPLKKL